MIVSGFTCDNGGLIPLTVELPTRPTAHVREAKYAARYEIARTKASLSLEKAVLERPRRQKLQRGSREGGFGLRVRVASNNLQSIAEGPLLAWPASFKATVFFASKVMEYLGYVSGSTNQMTATGRSEF